jgi:large subunit ribosomal protein L31
MRPKIHPNYVESQIVCACGTVYHTRSTKQNIRLGICAACHPFFTGQQKFVDTAGRIEKFTRRFGNVGNVKGAATTPAPASAPKGKPAVAAKKR